MRPIENWDKVQAQDGTFERLPAGGYVCIIKNAHVETSRNGNELMVVAFDIADGEHKDYYTRDYERRKGAVTNGSEVKWGGIYRQLLTDRAGAANPYFKGMLATIEKSNPGFSWNWDETKLRGKRIGFIFRDEEYLNQRGEIRVIAKPAWPRSIDEIRKGVVVPEMKKLTVQQAGFTPSPDASNVFSDYVSGVGEDKLPWD